MPMTVQEARKSAEEGRQREEDKLLRAAIESIDTKLNYNYTWDGKSVVPVRIKGYSFNFLGLPTHPNYTEMPVRLLDKLRMEYPDWNITEKNTILLLIPKDTKED